MIIDFYNEYSNVEVTHFYVDIIRSSLKRIHSATQNVKKIKYSKNNKNKGIVVVTAIDAIKARISGYKHVILWSQGIIPEESFMRHKSKLRFHILNMVEKIGLQCSDFLIYVSEAMKSHYKHKYKFETQMSYIMPCFNEEIKEESFFFPGKYTFNRFIYAGSTAKWQCFEECFRVYRKIEEQVDNAEFRILVKDFNYAMDLIKKYGIKHYSIDYVPIDKIPFEMSKAKFGFCIREDNEVNKVSTPTKFSTYISNGVIPIFTQNTEDFARIAKKSKYVFQYSNENDLIDLLNLCNNELEAVQVLEDYDKVFGNYYSVKYHESRLSKKLESLIYNPF